jgi:hypothetical protein
MFGHLQTVGINQAGNLRLTIRSEKEEDESRYLKEQNTKEHHLRQKMQT